MMKLRNSHEFYKDMIFEENCMEINTPTNGLMHLFNHAGTVCVDNNPLHDIEFAKNYAIDFYTHNNLIDYREACDLHIGNFLP
ncbi:MAG: hypothetical protein IKI28_06090 [Bacteroidales bacterium]|nr:hypothetical protein [Bacteroidales bacterium]